VKEFREQNLEIIFDDTWQCEKWDECASYRQGIGKLQGSDAVDFLGIRGNSLHLIEIKGYRDYRITRVCEDHRPHSRRAADPSHRVVIEDNPLDDPRVPGVTVSLERADT
jgi:hypothetical protein